MGHKKIEKIRVGRRANESEGLENNWENLDINKLTVPKGNVVFKLGGNTTNRLEAGNGNIKIVKSLVSEENQEDTTFYSFVYDGEPIKSDGYISSEYREEASILFEQTFRPVLFDENGYIKSKKGIEQAFSKMILSGHCGGCAIINIIVNKLYDTISEHYSKNTADLLINKIQYYAYAPSEALDHEVTSLVIAPYVDTSFSFIKSINIAEEEKVDIDFPRGAIKKLLLARKQGTLRNAFEDAFEDTRVIMFKIGSRTYLIPSQMNPNMSVGDHTIECVAKSKFLNSGTDCQTTARIVNYASRLFFNEALECGCVDTKKLFNDIAKKVENNPPKEKETLTK